MQLTEDERQNDVLRWLDAHSVSLSQGLPAPVLQRRWEGQGRPLEDLQAAIAALFDGQWIAITPGLQPPHLRFSPEGYRRLIEAQAAAAPLPDPVAEAVDTREAEAAAAAGPAGESLQTGDEGPQRLARKPGYAFLAPGRPATEVGLRNQVLHIFRDLGLRPGSLLIAMTISRYWQEYGLRAGDLRVALDVLQRDGYVRHRIKGLEVFWELTEEGHRFLRGGITPQALAECAPVVGERLAESPPDEVLEKQVLGLFGARRRQDWDSLRQSWRGDPNALIHGLDLLLKQGRLLHYLRPQLAFELPPDPDAPSTRGGLLGRLLG
ncbi:MAG TPA: hypothetical protein VFV27_11490 [Nevskiaceae bacterium]|nr:hypothetical protein [Nevskiaceae bacterium]